MKFRYIIFFILFTLLGCDFQPNNADGITISRKTNDTLEIGIIDSYHVINKCKVRQIDDTLFINVVSIHSPDKLLKPTYIYIDTVKVNYIKLQNDKLLYISSIPYIQ